MLDMVYTGSVILQIRLGDVWTSRMALVSAYMLYCLSAA